MLQFIKAIIQTMSCGERCSLFCQAPVGSPGVIDKTTWRYLGSLTRRNAEMLQGGLTADKMSRNTGDYYSARLLERCIAHGWGGDLARKLRARGD